MLQVLIFLTAFFFLQVDDKLIPFSFKGPTKTPPIKGYEAQDGEYIDTTKTFDQTKSSIDDCKICGFIKLFFLLPVVLNCFGMKRMVQSKTTLGNLEGLWLVFDLPLYKVDNNEYVYRTALQPKVALCGTLFKANGKILLKELV